MGALLGPKAPADHAIIMLLGVRRPDRGEAWLFGHPPHLPQSRSDVGATPQDTGFPFALTVSEVVELVRTHYPQPLPTATVLKRFGLLDLAHRQTGGLSGGERRPLPVALAFSGNPGAVFLDEPTTGLDVEARHGLWAVTRGYVQDEGTVLLTTHNMDEAEALASRVVVLDHGQKLTEGSVEAIRARVQLTRVRFQAEGLPQLPGIVQIEQENRLYTLYTTDADVLVRDLVRQGVAFAGIRSTRTLSSIVASCTSRQPTRPSPSMWLPAASVGGTTGTQRHRRTGLSSAGLRSRIARLSEVHLIAICWPSTPRLARCYGSKRRRTTINASSGTVQWRNQSSRPMVATVTATSTDLVFTGELNGDFAPGTAKKWPTDSRSSKRLWARQ